MSEDLDDTQLEQLLYPAPLPLIEGSRPLPDYDYIHAELRKKGVTLSLLWQEYKEQDPHGYQYSQFCHQYRKWAAKIDPVMRQEHRAGEKLFVDYAGQTVPVYDLHTNQMREAQIFVAVLGASSYTFAEATWTQELGAWIGSHMRAFEFYNGVTEIVVPDNLKSGVTKACRYEPEVGDTVLVAGQAECYFVIGLIADLDRPGSGFIGVDHQPLIDIQRSVTTESATLVRGEQARFADLSTR